MDAAECCTSALPPPGQVTVAASDPSRFREWKIDHAVAPLPAALGGRGDLQLQQPEAEGVEEGAAVGAAMINDLVCLERAHAAVLKLLEASFLDATATPEDEPHDDGRSDADSVADSDDDGSDSGSCAGVAVAASSGEAAMPGARVEPSPSADDDRSIFGLPPEDVAAAVAREALLVQIIERRGRDPRLSIRAESIVRKVCRRLRAIVVFRSPPPPGSGERVTDMFLCSFGGRVRVQHDTSDFGRHERSYASETAA